MVGAAPVRNPRLDRALKKIARRSGAVVQLDGALVRTRRRTGADNRKNYSGKHRARGLLFLALAYATQAPASRLFRATSLPPPAVACFRTVPGPC